jgi:uncharacterized membrane protein YcaP (DUF421 family)
MTNWLFSVDWQKYFVPEMTLPEILIWGTLLYLSLTILMRIVPKRQAGSASISDILFVVLIGGITVEALGKHGKGLMDFVLLLATIMLLSYLVEWLTYRFPRIRRLLEEAPTLLIKNGKVLKKNLNAEMLSEDELRAQLRLKEVSHPADVKEARLESEGDISVIKKDGEQQPGRERHRTNGLSHALRGLSRGSQPNQSDHQHAADPEESSLDTAVPEFLAAARRLGDAIAWHQAQAARHQADAAELRRLLAQHGIKSKRPHRVKD